MIHVPSNHPCRNCGDDIDLRRWALGYKHCMACGESLAKQVKHTVQIPYSKGAYQYIHNPEDMKITNPKRINRS